MQEHPNRFLYSSCGNIALERGASQIEEELSADPHPNRCRVCSNRVGRDYCNERQTLTFVQASLEMLRNYLITHPGSSESVRNLSYHVGREARHQVNPGGGMRTFVERSSTDWARLRLGDLAWEDRLKGTVRVRCANHRTSRGDRAETIYCAYMEGMIEAMLETSVGERFKVRRVSSGGKAAGCVFKIYGFV